MATSSTNNIILNNTYPRGNILSMLYESIELITKTIKHGYNTCFLLLDNEDEKKQVWKECKTQLDQHYSHFLEYVEYENHVKITINPPEKCFTSYEYGKNVSVGLNTNTDNYYRTPPQLSLTYFIMDNLVKRILKMAQKSMEYLPPIKEDRVSTTTFNTASTCWNDTIEKIIIKTAKNQGLKLQFSSYYPPVVQIWVYTHAKLSTVDNKSTTSHSMTLKMKKTMKNNENIMKMKKNDTGEGGIPSK
jgi:hypothetical protein